MSSKGVPHEGKLGGKVTEIIVSAVKSGLNKRDAATMAEISYESLRKWIQRGKIEDDGKYRDFYLCISKAEIHRKKSRLDIISDAAEEGDWKAAAWELERKHKQEFGKETNININTDNVKDPKKLTDEELEKDLIEMRKKIYG